MFFVSKKIDYALLAIYYMMSKCYDSTCSVKEIASEMNIPEKFLFHILKSLERAGIVAARKGSKGGYILLKSPEEITFKDLIEAVEGRIDLIECAGRDVLCSREQCLFIPAWKAIRKEFLKILENMTIAKALSKEFREKFSE